MAPKRGPSTPHPFAAAFDSECDACFEDIEEGDMIVRVDGGYVHSPICPEDDTRHGERYRYEGTDDESMGF